MKKLLCAILSAAMLAGCSAPAPATAPPESVSKEDFETKWADSGHVRILLDDTLPAVTLPEGMPEDAVTFANDIIYYEEGHDYTYGEGGKGETHSAEEAARHTVVHINAPGTYVLTGRLSAGQIAVDLGEDAADDPGAVVTLILDGADITCAVAPAVIFYNVYECGDPENPSAIVDTSAAGANVILADGSRNFVNGSHVAKIYKPGSVIDGDTENAKRLHKYDAAFYSKMSMNVGGAGSLDITADNEGLDSELHLTINGGDITIQSGNDGINTNEDGVSVTTINGGTLRIEVTGSTGEGDGIDSNGWLVINGGKVAAYGCGTSGDAGIDSDMGIQLHGGTVIATGNMLDRIEDGGQTHVVFTFAQQQGAGTYTLKNDQGEAVMEMAAPNSFQYLLLSSPVLTEGSYTLWSGDTQFQGYPSGGVGGFRGDGAQIIERPEWPGREDGDVQIPPQPSMPLEPKGDQPEDMPVADFSEGFDPGQMPVPPMPPEGGDISIPDLPEGVEPPEGGHGMPTFPATGILGDPLTEFPVQAGANYFIRLTAVE